jgi:hypothetical protein
MLKRTEAMLGAMAKIAGACPHSPEVEDMFGPTRLNRARPLGRLGSPLSNGGTSFPTAFGKTGGFALHDDFNCPNLVYFLQLMDDAADKTKMKQSQDSGSLIATLHSVVLDTSVSL